MKNLFKSLLKTFAELGTAFLVVLIAHVLSMFVDFYLLCIIIFLAVLLINYYYFKNKKK